MNEMRNIRVARLRKKAVWQLTGTGTKIAYIIQKFEDEDMPACRVKREMMGLLPTLYKQVKRCEMLGNEGLVKAAGWDKQEQRDYYDILDSIHRYYDFIGETVDLQARICYSRPEYSDQRKDV